jgi:uncharacterized membrane protein
MWLHVASAVLALLAYLAGRRIFARNAAAAFGLSFLGFVLVIFTIWYGSQSTYAHGL